MSETFRTVFISGATGTFGNAMTRFLLDHTSATIRLYSRDELKQSEMSQRFARDFARLRFFLGDVRDFARLQLAMDGVDLVFHAAALKQVPSAEYNIGEVIRTNILGTENVALAARNMGVQRVVFLSTDKSVYAINSYGVSKAMAERTMIQANAYAPHKTGYCCVRYGNVWQSRGSVGKVWAEALQQNLPLRITNLLMSRFYISLYEAVALAWFAACYTPRGTILVPHLSWYTMQDLMQALCEEACVTHPTIENIGIRPGEKMHESLLTDDEAQRLAMYTEDGLIPKYYAIQPVAPSWEMQALDAWRVPDPVLAREPAPWRLHQLQHRYESNTWPWRLSVEELRQRLREG